MNIRQCYTVLELPMRAPLNEVKLSYKDLVQVWHPDRFAHSPRLQEKAATKLQLLNEAYDTLKNHLERQSVQGAYGYGTAAQGTANPPEAGSAGYGSAGYGAAGAKTAAQAEPGARTATASDRTTTASDFSGSKAKVQASSQVPSFFDSGGSYSWKWQLQATGLIFGFIGLMLLPIGLAMLIAEHPLLIILLMPLPVMAYVYRIWVTR